MDPLSTEILFFLLFIAFLAGVIDAIAGGGGLISLPALLWVGVPPINALATNKLQGTFGTATASIQFIRHRKIDFHLLFLPILYTFFGAVIGSLSVQSLPNDWLYKIIPVLLIAFAVYFLISPNAKTKNIKKKMLGHTFGLIVGFTIGFYDGFFGPGTGSFFTASFIVFMGMSMSDAIANTKILNFASNLASLIFFTLSGSVFWKIGLVMGIGQIIGAWVGSNLAITHGEKLIRPFLFLVCSAISIKILIAGEV